MSRGYGKYRRGGGSHSSFHFDNLFKENSNKPSAAKSAATVGKWGITSFTSIRTLNGLSRENDRTPEAAPKPKKFFKSRNTDTPDSSASYSKSPPGYVPPKRSKPSYEPTERPTRASSPRKFFSSKGGAGAEKTVLSSNMNKGRAAKAPKPPIVLRICRGKSQLLNDSDESESTPTPASTPSTSSATSPRSTREPVRPATSGRITRSARRSLQQEAGCSPPAADTPLELALPDGSSGSGAAAPSPGVAASPQYIPAEEYELERRAMYDNLLRPSSPRDSRTEATGGEVGVEEKGDEEDGVGEGEGVPLAEESTEGRDEKAEEEEPMEEEEEGADPAEAEPPAEKSPKAERPVSPAPIEEEPEAAPPPKPTAEIEEEWSTDSDSNSTAAELEVKQILPEPDFGANPVAERKNEILDRILEKPVEQAAPPVKLVISKKKGSIFKSRSLVGDNAGTKKRRALYTHKWTDDNKEDAKEVVKTNEVEAIASTTLGDDEFGFKNDPLERITKGTDDGEITTIKCSKTDKGFYTVVRNVKQAHQIQEIGEFQEFNDDVEYILDALQDDNPTSTRCLSAITLASKCMAPAFRMHVRAHGTVSKFFKALHDATKDQSLGLCTATVMFVLSQDRLNMDLDRDCLELMLNLLESDVSYQQALDVCGLSSGQLDKNKQRVRELCAEIQSQGHAMHLNLESITVGQLAMETLLSLTSKRAGEWFKEELRELGGLEHIMKTIHECCRQVSDYVVTWTDTLLDKLKKVDRCLRVLENVTHNNEENQNYILKYENGAILDTLVNLYKLCDGEIPLYPVTDIGDKTSTGTVIREALLVTLKVLINLTHHFNKQSIGSQLIGSRAGIIETSLHLLLQVPNYIPEQKKFELGVLVLMLLINLIQDQDANKKLLMDAKAPSKLESIYSREESAVEALITQFYHWEGCAKIAENKTNAILDGEKDGEDAPTPKSNEEFIEETVAKLLQKAGTHMEFTFLASYIVMVVGFLIMDNVEWQTFVRQFLKGSNFGDMVELLRKFFNFMNLTASTEASSVCAIKATEKVIKFLEDCDKPPAESSPDKPVAFYENMGMDLSFRLTP